MTILIRNLGEMHSTIDSILSNYDGDGPIRVVWPRRIKKNVQNFQRLFSGNVVGTVTYYENIGIIITTNGYKKPLLKTSL